MPNFRTHATTGAIAGVITGVSLNYINQSKRIENVDTRKLDYSEMALSGVGGAVVGTIGGVLPDILEPANSPFHRKTFHSWVAAGLVSYGLHVLNKSNLPKLVRDTLTTAGIGYLSHLALDSRTPKGLPII